MSLFKGSIIFASVAVFGGFHYFLNVDRGVSSAPVAGGEQRVIQEMAVFIEGHPDLVSGNRNVSEPRSEPRSHGGTHEDVPAPVLQDPEVFGVALNRATIEKLHTPEGSAEIQLRMSQNPNAAMHELKQAWKILDPADIERREALQELTVAFRRVNSDPELALSLVQEVKRVNLEPNLSDEKLEYVGRTLQRHLNAEKDEQRLVEQLQELGIPRVVVESPEAGRAPASGDSGK